LYIHVDPPYKSTVHKELSTCVHHYLEPISRCGTKISSRGFLEGRKPLEIGGFGPILGAFARRNGLKSVKIQGCNKANQEGNPATVLSGGEILIFLEGLRGETPISEICRREGIASSVYGSRDSCDLL
jgi:hypothetical protein